MCDTIISMDAEMRARVFKALSDPTRIRIVEFLSSSCCGRAALRPDGGVENPTAGEVCCYITGANKITSTISHHLHELESVGLIRLEKRGKATLCTISPSRLTDLAEYLTQLAEAHEHGIALHRPQGKTMSTNDLNTREDVRELVKQKYGEAALRVMNNQPSSCCGGSSPEPNAPFCTETKPASEDGCCSKVVDPITSNLYSEIEASELPETALLASLGCGNPTALAELREGETVLDLGSGGGIDVLLSARRVGPSGFAYGLDMTDEMLALAENNKAESQAENVKFLKGHIEDIPLPNDSVDVIISNCVINLSADKDRVFREAFRVLKPGGRFAVSDVVVEEKLPDPVRRDMEMYVGCVSGALEREEYISRLTAAGFAEASIEPTRRYEFSGLEGAWAPKGVAAMTDEEKRALDGKIMGAFIRAIKPA